MSKLTNTPKPSAVALSKPAVAPAPLEVTEINVDELGTEDSNERKPGWFKLGLEAFANAKPAEMDAWHKEAQELDAAFINSLNDFGMQWKKKLADVLTVLGKNDVRMKVQMLRNVQRNAPRNRYGSWVGELAKRTALAKALLSK